MSEITLSDVREAVECILSLDASGLDPEHAHGEQDKLYVDVLRAASDGHPDAGAMADECLRVAQSKGERWFA